MIHFFFLSLLHWSTLPFYAWCSISSDIQEMTKVGNCFKKQTQQFLSKDLNREGQTKMQMRAAGVRHLFMVIWFFCFFNFHTCDERVLPTRLREPAGALAAGAAVSTGQQTWPRHTAEAASLGHSGPLRPWCWHHPVGAVRAVGAAPGPRLAGPS